MCEFIVCVGLFGAVNLLFVICGLIADYLLPYIKPLESWIDTLPLMQTEAQPQEKGFNHAHNTQEVLNNS